MVELFDLTDKDTKLYTLNSKLFTDSIPQLTLRLSAKACKNSAPSCAPVGAQAQAEGAKASKKQ